MEKIRNKDGKIVSYREKVYINGKTVTRTFKRKSDASNWKKNHHAEVQRREALGIGQIESISFKEFTKLWLEIKQNEGMAIKTMSEFRSVIKNYLNPFVENKKLEKITQVHAQQVVRLGRERKLCAARLNKLLIIFNQILGDAAKLSYLIKNPLTGINKVKVHQKSLTYWLPHQIEQFLVANQSDPHYPIFLLALNTGMRRGELMGLCWDKIDLANHKLEIARIRDRYGLRDTTKTGKVRSIPLNKVSLEILRELSQDKGHPDLVLTYQDGSLPDPNHLSNRPFKRAIERADVPRIRFHDLRTTYASNFVMSGGDIFALSRLLGHTSVEMTAKRYAALHPNFMKDVVDTVNFSAN